MVGELLVGQLEEGRRQQQESLRWRVAPERQQHRTNQLDAGADDGRRRQPWNRMLVGVEEDRTYQLVVLRTPRRRRLREPESDREVNQGTETALEDGDKRPPTLRTAVPGETQFGRRPRGRSSSPPCERKSAPGAQEIMQKNDHRSEIRSASVPNVNRMDRRADPSRDPRYACLRALAGLNRRRSGTASRRTAALALVLTLHRRPARG